MPIDVSRRSSRQNDKIQQFRGRQSAQHYIFRRQKAVGGTSQKNSVLSAALAVASVAAVSAVDPYGNFSYCGQPAHGVGAYCVSINSAEYTTPTGTIPSPEFNGSSPYTVLTEYARNATGPACIMVSYPAGSALNCSGSQIGPYLYGEPNGAPGNVSGFNVSAQFAVCQDAQGNFPNPNTSTALCFGQARQNADAAVKALYPSTPSPSGGLSHGAKIGIGVGVGVGVPALAALALALHKWRSRKAAARAEGDYVAAPELAGI